MKNTLLIFSVFLAGATLTTWAQVAVTTEQSKDKSTTSSQVVVTTPTQTSVPLTVETQKTNPDADTTKTETITRARNAQGAYVDWRSTNSETKKSGGTTVSTSDTTETDRQGVTRTLQSTTERIVKSPDGSEHATSTQYHRDSSGEMKAVNQSVANSTPNPDGSVSTTRVDSQAGENGGFIPVQRVNEVTTKVSDQETKTDKTIETINHMDGGYIPSTRESTVVQKTADSSTTETVIQKPAGTGWQTEGIVTTTETRAPDGTVQRETVEQSRPSFAQSDNGPGSSEPLEPRTKTIEKDVVQPDGSTVTERQVLHRDVNGDWKAEDFSTSLANKGY